MCEGFEAIKELLQCLNERQKRYITMLGLTRWYVLCICMVSDVTCVRLQICVISHIYIFINEYESTLVDTSYYNRLSIVTLCNLILHIIHSTVFIVIAVI